MSGVYSTTEWLRARRDALDRDKVCQDCGTSEHLHVHHIEPVRSFVDPLEAHELENLVVLCRRCHPKWEGSEAVPNLLDAESGLKKSELVHDLSRETIIDIRPEPAPRDVEDLFRSLFTNRRDRCGYCYSPLQTTRGEMLRESKRRKSDGHLCETCGRLPHFWRNFHGGGAPGTEQMKRRCEHMAAGLAKKGLNLDVDAMKAAVGVTWPNDKYFGEVDAVTRFAVRMGAKHADDPVSESIYHTPCPEPGPISPV